jgi:hypothetical protein
VIYNEPARTTYRTRIRRGRFAGLLVVCAAIALGIAYGIPASSSPSSPATPPLDVPRGSEHLRPLGEADGAVPDGTTVFDDGVPGVAGLDAALLDALRRAATDAANDGVRFVVDSGWRSPAYQEHLLRQAVAKYGSEQEARRWVASPATSEHVSGAAVDIGPSAAAGWLSRRGASYGLCPVYANEPWHYELRPDAPGHGCPPTYADPTHDPRMQG